MGGVIEPRPAPLGADAERSLRRAICEASSEGLLAVDPAGRVVAWSSALLALGRLPPTVLEAGSAAKVHARLLAGVRLPDEAAERLAARISRPSEAALDLLAYDDGRRVERRCAPWPSLTGLGQLWTFTDVTARARLAEAHRRAAFLAEAGALLAESLDHRATLARLVDLYTRELADWCVVYLMEDGALFRAAWAHADPEKQPLTEELNRRFPPTQSVLLRQVIEPRRTLLIPQVDEAVLARFFPNEEHRALVRRLGMLSVMIVPLVADGQAVGCLSLNSNQPERRYGAEDVELAQELARRAAMAIQHARLYRQAQDAIGVREEFLTLASHELKTPLTPISLVIQILRKRAEQYLPIDASLVERAQRPLERLTGLINDLLDISRIQAGRLRVLPAPTPLRDLLRELVEAHRLTAPDHPLELVEPPEELVVLGDRARLAQVISNLLDNAVKYSPPGSPVRVALQAQEGQALLSVQDSGIGIPPEQRQQVFERFFRARNAPSSHYGGLGLGLYIARDIVERHRGRIWVESELGRGSTFFAALPLMR
jgi:signal transduction histidine kinase